MSIKDGQTSAQLHSLPSKWLEKVVFLGTGTSGQVPAIHCVTRPDYGGCDACQDATLNPTGKNRRGCTAAVLVGQDEEDAATSAILIDCGKTFYSNAVVQFPRNNIRSIRAVLLTHAHADAILGLDDLRAWTMGGVIQPFIDIFLTQDCMVVVEGMFPYLVDRSKSTGGGDVPSLRWNIINKDQPFTIPASKSCKEVCVTPLPVLHGFLDRTKAFWSLGFRVDTFSYISDCHKIPLSTVDLMKGSEAIVMDALKMDRHLSHFSFSQALSFFASFDPPPSLGLLTDFTHRIEHYSTQKLVDEWRNGMLAYQLEEISERSVENQSYGYGEAGGQRWWTQIWDEQANEQQMTVKLKKICGRSLTDQDAKSVPHFIPPIKLAWDGMVVLFSRNRTVT